MFNPDSFMAVVAIFGPLLVAAITGLKTSSAVKAGLAVALVAIFTAVKAIGAGGFTSDVFGNLLLVVPVWQGFYNMLWKGTGVAAWLQEHFPIKLGEVVDEEIVADDGFTPAD